MARWDKRKVKTIIQDYNRTFLGSQQFLKCKPGALESYTILLRHHGFLNKFLLQGTQGHHKLNMDQFLRGGYESSPPWGSPPDQYSQKSKLHFINIITLVVCTTIYLLVLWHYDL